MAKRDLDHFLTRLRDLRWLGQQPDGGRTVMDSSLNQRMGPRDCNYFLRDEVEDGRRWHVLVDYTGPGCITRFWTAGDFDGDLEVYLDGAARPAVRTTLRSFFGGGTPPFAGPLVLDCAASSMGRVSYFPIPFARGCRIRAASDTRSFYWQINASLYEEGEAVASLPAALSPDEARSLAATSARWADDNGMGSAPVPDTQVEVPARDQVTLCDETGAGWLTGLSFRLADATDDPTRLALRLYWDGAAEPAVAAPLGHFFCQGSKRRDFHSLLLARQGATLSTAFPMPFATGARLELVNPTTAPVRLSWGAGREAGEPDTDLRFHCRYRRERFGYGTIFQLLNLQGRGRFVGLNQVTQQLGSPAHACFNQEGNEYFYVDGEQDPSWCGTGTEDYFNCAYFYRLGEVDTPTHGCLDQRHGDDGAGARGRVSAYRLHLLDAVPFATSLVALQEAGCPKKGALAGVNGVEELDYQWTAYWYQADEATAGASAPSRVIAD